MKDNKKNYRAIIFLSLTVLAFSMTFLLKKNDSIFKNSTQITIEGELPAPNFTFPDLNGNLISLSDFKGNVIIVNVWATWCPPCVYEMPSMEKLYQEFKGDDFEILAISIDTLGIKAVTPFMKKYKLTFPALIDTEGEIKTLYKATGIPESFIIDKEGILIKKIIGARNWASPQVFRFFRDLIQKPLAQKG